MALLTIAPDEESLAASAAARFCALATDAIRGGRTARICLTGGSTPRQMYQRLATGVSCADLSWPRIHLYWSDERHVPPDHQDSNYRMARESLLAHVTVPESQVHRIKGELPPEEASMLYEEELPDRFDLMLLGVGADAHIASIFPRSPLLTERSRRAAALWAPHLNAYRVTLTPRALLDADHIVLVVAGPSKAEAVAAAIDGAFDLDRYPVHLLREAGNRVEWFIDRAAARALSSPPA